MSNEINTRQNTEHALCYLAAQRQLYNEAKNFTFYEIIAIFIVSLIIPICQQFNIKIVLENIDLSTLLVGIINLIIPHLLRNKQSQIKSIAATIQQYFDTFVYNMSWDSLLFGEKINLNDIIAKKSKKILSNPKEKEKLLNWYTNIDVNLPLNEGILMCQKQNYVWETTLRKRFLYFTSFISFIFILIMLLLLNKDISILTIIPIFINLFKLCFRIKTDLDNIKEIDTLVWSPKHKTMTTLKKIQSKIFLYRKSAFCIPSKFYMLFKNNDENTTHRMAQLDKDDFYLKK